jgi:anti-anti-sigma factor
MPRQDRTSGLAEESVSEGRNKMSASTFGSEPRNGAIRVVPETDAIVTLCLEGDFDLANASTLGDQIDRALVSGNDLILDLSDATFIDSSVINVLVRASKAAVDRKRTMVLQLGTAAIVERVLEVSRIEQVLPRAYDRRAALRIIRKQTEAA